MIPRFVFLLAAIDFGITFATSQSRIPVVSTKSLGVSITSMSLTDRSRSDPFARDGRARSIMISGFSPVASCQHTHLEAYMPTATSDFEDAKFAAYGLPHGTFASLGLQTCDSSRSYKFSSFGSLPLVVFSGALGTSRTLYHGMLQSVAAAGYLVISVDHPYDADIVEFPNGTTVNGVDISDTELETALDTRVKDITFLYKELKKAPLRRILFPTHRDSGALPKTAIFGHSFGGATAAAAMQQLDYIQGGLNLDGTLFGSVLEKGLDRPFMLVGHENKTQATDQSWKTVWKQLKGWKKEIEVKGSAHYSFSDLPLITAVVGLQGKLPVGVEAVLGTIEGHRMMELTVTYVATFLNMILKSGPTSDFWRANNQFPEVCNVAQSNHEQKLLE